MGSFFKNIIKAAGESGDLVLPVQELPVQQDRPELIGAQGAPALGGDAGGAGIETLRTDAAALHALLPLDHIGAAHLAAAAHTDRLFSYLL